MENKKDILVKVSISQAMNPRVYAMMENMPPKHRSEKLRQLINTGELIDSQRITFSYVVNFGNGSPPLNHQQVDGFESGNENQRNMEISKEELAEDLAMYGMYS